MDLLTPNSAAAVRGPTRISSAIVVTCHRWPGHVLTLNVLKLDLSEVPCGVQ